MRIVNEKILLKLSLPCERHVSRSKRDPAGHRVLDPE